MGTVSLPSSQLELQGQLEKEEAGGLRDHGPQSVAGSVEGHGASLLQHRVLFVWISEGPAPAASRPPWGSSK